MIRSAEQFISVNILLYTCRQPAYALIVMISDARAGCVCVRAVSVVAADCSVPAIFSAVLRLYAYRFPLQHHTLPLPARGCSTLSRFLTFCMVSARHALSGCLCSSGITCQRPFLFLVAWFIGRAAALARKPRTAAAQQTSVAAARYAFTHLPPRRARETRTLQNAGLFCALARYHYACVTRA